MIRASNILIVIYTKKKKESEREDDLFIVGIKAKTIEKTRETHQKHDRQETYNKKKEGKTSVDLQIVDMSIIINISRKFKSL